jgi:hypothetical protein
MVEMDREVDGPLVGDLSSTPGQRLAPQFQFAALLADAASIFLHRGRFIRHLTTNKQSSQ